MTYPRSVNVVYARNGLRFEASAASPTQIDVGAQGLPAYVEVGDIVRVDGVPHRVKKNDGAMTRDPTSTRGAFIVSARLTLESLARNFYRQIWRIPPERRSAKVVLV